jgi:hypothetical protein
MDGLRRTGRGVHALLLLAFLVGSAAYCVGAGWRGLVGLVPACQDGDGYVTCISGRQPSGLAWYGTAFAVVMWLALLRWAETSVMLGFAARAVITLGTGMYAAELIRGGQPRSLVCTPDPNGGCLEFIRPFTLTQAALGLLIGAVVAFALLPPRFGVALAARRLARAGATAPSLDRA